MITQWISAETVAAEVDVALWKIWVRQPKFPVELYFCSFWNRLYDCIIEKELKSIIDCTYIVDLLRGACYWNASRNIMFSLSKH